MSSILLPLSVIDGAIAIFEPFDKLAVHGTADASVSGGLFCHEQSTSLL